jgi:hypothetical protein
MLTALDKPLDALEDLTPAEVYVRLKDLRTGII